MYTYIIGEEIVQEYLEELDDLRNNAAKIKNQSTEIGDDIMVY